MKKDPCNNCIMLAMCVNKNWIQIVRTCKPIADHMMEMSGLNKIKGHTYLKYHVEALNKTFGIRRTTTDIVMFGKYWEMKKLKFESTKTLAPGDVAYLVLDNKYVEL